METLMDHGHVKMFNRDNIFESMFFLCTAKLDEI